MQSFLSPLSFCPSQSYSHIHLENRGLSVSSTDLMGPDAPWVFVLSRHPAASCQAASKQTNLTTNTAATYYFIQLSTKISNVLLVAASEFFLLTAELKTCKKLQLNTFLLFEQHGCGKDIKNKLCVKRKSPPFFFS